MQSKLKITSKGQITLRRDLLKELEAGPGDPVLVTVAAPGELRIRSAPRGDINDFIGCLKNEHDIHLTIDEINEAIAAAWAGER